MVLDIHRIYDGIDFSSTNIHWIINIYNYMLLEQSYWMGEFRFVAIYTHNIQCNVVDSSWKQQQLMIFIANSITDMY